MIIDKNFEFKLHSLNYMRLQKGVTTVNRHNSDFSLHILLATNLALFIVPYMSNTLEEVQWLGGIFTPALNNGEYYRLISSMFIHFGFVHLFLNMTALFKYGSYVIETFGNFRFLFIYMFTGLASSIGVWFLQNPNTLTAGASGALYGLSGFIIAYLGISQNYRIGNVTRKDTKDMFVYLILWNVIPSISVIGHVSGMFAGLLLGCIYAKIDKYKLNRRLRAWRKKE